jgi:hypothetical protein
MSGATAHFVAKKAATAAENANRRGNRSGEWDRTGPASGTAASAGGVAHMATESSTQTIRTVGLIEADGVSPGPVFRVHSVERGIPLPRGASRAIPERLCLTYAIAGFPVPPPAQNGK